VNPVPFDHVLARGDPSGAAAAGEGGNPLVAALLGSGSSASSSIPSSGASSFSARPSRPARRGVSVALGSPDILDVFPAVTHALKYDAVMEDFAMGDAARLDRWVFERTLVALGAAAAAAAATDDARAAARGSTVIDSQALPARPNATGATTTWALSAAERAAAQRAGADLARTADEGGSILFLHLLGLDTNGHAHRPDSPEYLENIRYVDAGIRAVHAAVEAAFPDNSTAYLFTADHGMSNRGSHGDGDPDNTRTPIVAWGAGVSPPERVSDDAVERGTWQPPTDIPGTLHWSRRGLGDRVHRHDITQADIAPLITALLGEPFPLNSVGVLPAAYLRGSVPRSDLSAMLVANAAQVAEQLIMRAESRFNKTTIKALVRPFARLSTRAAVDARLAEAQRLIAATRFDEAELIAGALVRDALDGLEHYQAHDAPTMLGAAVMGYIGVAVALVLEAAAPAVGVFFFFFFFSKFYVGFSYYI
jgi:hypothetical protein